MRIVNCAQGTPEWLLARSGIPTASAMHRIVTPKRLELSDGAAGYMNQLMAERMMGEPIVEHVSFWMERGSEMESKAVNYYEFQRDTETVPVGFITNDDGTIGASPDRLVGEIGLLEVKCPKPEIHVGYLRKEAGAYSKYRIQAQAQLWIAERQWVDFLSFHPDLPPSLIRIDRDEAFIDKLKSAVRAFSVELEEEWRVALERGWVKPQRPIKEKAPVTDSLDAMAERMARKGVLPPEWARA